MTSSPFGVNTTQRRLQLFELGYERMTRFCLVNDIQAPRVLNAYADGNTGMYFPGFNKMHVDLPVTALDVQNPAHMRWSWPGYKTDRTACGVICHENGHHFEYVLAKAKRFKYKEWNEARQGKKVSGYEPNRAEAFAETMRLFTLNPDLLKEAMSVYRDRLNRYTYLTEVLGLVPSETRSWKEVIGNPKYYPAAEKWIAAK